MILVFDLEQAGLRKLQSEKHLEWDGSTFLRKKNQKF